ncbi:MAG TPA: nucleotidyltransferase domain-containing protein [Ktedonobacterales bacterium]
MRGGTGALDEATLSELARRFGGAGVEALALTGSYARGDATRFSDIDLLRFTAIPPVSEREVYRLWPLGERLVSVTTTTIAAKRAEMARPELLMWVVRGLAQARVLADSDGRLAALIAEARAFAWTPDLRAAAHAYASDLLAGLAEEALKLLGALEHDNASAALYATVGLEMGLTRALLVARGVLLSTENDYFDAALTLAGLRWRRLLRLVADYDAPPAGEDPPRARGAAALRLYAEAARLLADTLVEDDRAIIAPTVARIQQTLGATP